MARGRTTSLTIYLTPAERQTLLAWQRSTAIPAGYARRGRIILLLADGMTITAIAATVGISRRFVYKWVQRFRLAGVEGLTDKPRHDRLCWLSPPLNTARFGVTRDAVPTEQSGLAFVGARPTAEGVAELWICYSLVEEETHQAE